MNLKELLNDDKYTDICIPRIQRDYAQGRNTQKVKDIRHDFLNDIFSGEPINLNMIFGDVDNETYPNRRRFIPIDGQQRLTTLYLLHIYAHKNIDGIQIPHLDKFCYETRTSSNDFVKALLENEWPKVVRGESVDDALKKCSWFWWIWEKDPSVSGMLTMLGEIEAVYREKGIFPDLDKITFDFQDLRENNLNETLYIKMNSRGLPLTEFEQIKCGFEELLSSLSFDEEKDITKAFFPINHYHFDFSQFWKWQMDRDWIEWFWDKKTHSLDENILWFIIEFTCGFYSSHSSEPNETIKSKILNLWERNDNQTQEVSWQSVRKLFESYDKEGKKELKTSLLKEYFIRLASILNRITKLKEDLITSWGEEYQFRHKDKDKWMRQRAMIYALSCYGGERFEGEKFALWFRFCSNIIQHYTFSEEGFISFCNSFEKEYRAHSLDIIKWLATEPGSQNYQFVEETKKAVLLLRGVNQVLDAESHPLFKGRIRQLLIDSDGNYTGIFNNLKWINLQRYFDKRGEIRKDYWGLFSVAFIKSLTRSNQLFEEQQILDHSLSTTYSRLQRKRYEGAYDRCFSASDLEKVTYLEWRENDIEKKQYRDQILQPGIIKKIIGEDEQWVKKMRFKLFGTCWFFYPLGKKSSDWYIGLDRFKEGNLLWNRSRNLFTSLLLKDGYELLQTPKIENNVNLWWEQTYKFRLGDMIFDWDCNYNIHLLNNNLEKIKIPHTENEYYHFSTIGLDYQKLKDKILELYKKYIEN